MILGVVKDAAGNAVPDATIDLRGCCNSDQPCLFTTDWAGRWGYSESIGWSFTSSNCSYIVSKLGFNNVTGSFAIDTNTKCGDKSTVKTNVVLN